MVYQTAEEFAKGASTDVVKATLTTCSVFDEDDVEAILAQVNPHRTDKDGGYHAFIRAVNKVIGEDVYCERSKTD